MKKIVHIGMFITLLACGKKDSSGNPVAEVAPEQPAQPTTEVATRDPNNCVTPEGETIRTTIASTPAQQTKGLQNVQDVDFDDDEGMLFFYKKDGARSFWMPHTYFNLDLIYLNKDFKIIEIVWNLPHYTGNVNSQIPRAPTVFSRHVLEMKAGSPLSTKLKVGDGLICPK